MIGDNQSVSGVPLDPEQQQLELQRRGLIALPAQQKVGAIPPVAAQAAPAAKPQTAVAQPSTAAAATPAPVGGVPAVGASQPAAPPTPPSAADKQIAYEQNRLATAEKPAGVNTLMDKAKNIDTSSPSLIGRIGKNIGKIGAEVGAGALRGLSTAGDILTPGVMANIPGTESNRRMNMIAARAGLDNAEKSKLQEAQADEAVSKATGAANQEKLVADMASKGYSPVLNSLTGQTSWQYTGQGEQKIELDPRQTIPDPNDPGKQIANPGYQKTPVYVTRDPQNNVLRVGGTAAEAQKQLTPGQQPVTQDRVQQIQNEISALPNLSDKQRKDFAANPNMSSDEAEKQLADARDADARIGSSNELKQRQGEQATAKLQGEKDKAINSSADTLKKDQAKIDDATQAMEMLRQPNGMKDALVVVKGLVVTAGGQGSGVRITTAELNRIAQSRGWTGSVDVLMNNFFNPDNFESLNPQQRTELQGIVQGVLDRVGKRTDMIYAERDAIRNATTVDQINQIENTFDKQMQAMGKGKDYSINDPVFQSYVKDHFKGDVNAAKKYMDKTGYVEVD